jgi:hypothetical protein
MTGELTDYPNNQLKTDWLTNKLTNQPINSMWQSPWEADRRQEVNFALH